MGGYCQPKTQIDSAMRKRFEPQLSIGQRPIEETPICIKNSGALDGLLAALKAIFCNKEYNEKIFQALEDGLPKGKSNSGRKGMCLWQCFVLAQVRLCMNISYEELYNLANNHFALRFLMGAEREFGFERIGFEYQNIYDNVSLLDDALVSRLNDIIVSFGHAEVFKKKENAPLSLKTDSFVVESNVHFPTDYNLLWDCARKCISIAEQASAQGWRKSKHWRRDLKGLMRELGKASSSGIKGREARVMAAAEAYLAKAGALEAKLKGIIGSASPETEAMLCRMIELERFIRLLSRHINLVDRRIIKKEKIPHAEKMFSVFETYTEWINKGKSRPSVELGKMVAITTDQYNLIINYLIMDEEKDRDVVVKIADSVLLKHAVKLWSFDKGYWSFENKQILKLAVDDVIMPKLGKRSKAEEEEETSPAFRRAKNKHSAVESNINELEHRGLDRCPDRGYAHFCRYVGLGICAYNLKKIGARIIQDAQKALEKQRPAA